MALIITKWDQDNCLDSVETISRLENGLENLINTFANELAKQSLDGLIFMSIWLVVRRIYRDKH